MPKTVHRGPALRKALRSSRDTNSKSVSVFFLGDDLNEHEITLAIQCVPVTISALVNEYGRVLSALPVPARPALQAMQGTGIVPAIGANGTPALILQLKGGGELTIEFPKAAMAQASQRITEILVAMGKGQFY